MVITPDSTIKLYRDVDICDDERLVFSSTEKRDAYFANRLVKTVTECTIVKHQNGVIRLDIPGSLAARCNYMSFKNPSFENKEIYCRIAMIPEYTNNECTQLAYVIDYWMSYYDEVHFEDMYIDREHLSVSKYNLSLDDPYNQSLWEFRTNEPLQISNDTEQLFFDTNKMISLFKQAAIDSDMSSTLATQFYDLIYMSDIDFEALDANVTYEDEPSSVYNQFATGGMDFKIDYSQTTPLTYGEHFANLVGPFNNIRIFSNFKPGFKLIGLCSKNYTRDFGYYDRTGDESLTTFLDNLTKWGVLSSVIAIYRVPAVMVRTIFMTSQSSTILPEFKLPSVEVDNRPDNYTEYTNKKLANFPFSYMRLLSPLNEDIKELRHEKFYTNAKFYLTLDISERPTIMVLPGNYEYYDSENDITSFLVTSRNAMIYNKIPTAPYTIDSWLAQMSANAQAIIANNTTEYMYQMGQEHLAVTSREIQNRYGGANSIAGAVGVGLDLVTGNWGNAARGFVNTAAATEQLGVNIASANLARQSLQNRANMSDEAYNALAGAQEGNPVYSNFVETRPAYAANKYVAPSGDGILNYHPSTNFDIVVLGVTLNQAILEKYDKWFDNFGYASGRCGIPYVINYALGSQAESNIPHFATMSDGKLMTYVKTDNCRVSHTQAIVSQSISQLFNNGVRFIKGDDL